MLKKAADSLVTRGSSLSRKKRLRFIFPKRKETCEIEIEE